MNSQHKKVDFCLYIEPSCDEDHPDVPKEIAKICDSLPHRVFNHTSLPTLINRPIALSIETKKPGEGWENAQLQMGVWNAAHWEFLDRLLRIKHQGSHRQPVEDASAVPRTLEQGVDTEGPTMQLPVYLPGIIIQGHDWHLVVTTREGEKTIFWHKVTFGSTSNSMGIYQIICTLQVLSAWARDEYWPWLRAVVT